MKISFRVVSAVAVLVALNPLKTHADVVGVQMATAANQLLAILGEEKAAKARFDLKDEERMNWHYVPYERKGLSMKDMDSVQRQLTFALLSSGLSGRGSMQAITIMTLEQILWEMENHAPKRDPENYLVSIFGEPAKDGTWGWRVEGHHLSINFTLKDGAVVSGTPIFFGTNPARVKEGPRKGLELLAREEYLARKLVTMLDEKQQKKAIIDAVAPQDVFTKEEPRVQPLEAKGLPVSKMTEDQKAVLMQIVREYVGRHRLELARADLKKFEESDEEKILFAWAGGTEKGEGHYYRVQTPEFLFEYANTQNDANHAHAVWRDFDGDFGEDVLAKHLREEHGAEVVVK